MSSNRAPQLGDIEVPPGEWESFLDHFSDQHEGWLVNIFEDTSVIVNERRLRRIALDANNGTHPIEIRTGGRDGDELVHTVPAPTHLTFKQSSTGAHEGLDITSVDGIVTSLRFRVAARPETLDGVLAIADYGGVAWAGAWTLPSRSMS